MVSILGLPYFTPRGHLPRLNWSTRALLVEILSCQSPSVFYCVYTDERGCVLPAAHRDGL